MLKKRILTGIFLAVIILIVFLFSYLDCVMIIASSILSTLAIYELFQVTKPYKRKPLIVITLILNLLIQTLPIPYFDFIIKCLLIIGIVIFVYLMSNCKRLNRISTLTSIVVSILITMFYKTIINLRAMHNGSYLLALTILVSVITDTGAYCFGKAFGKHPLAPILSPKKTIEGAIGGLISTMIILNLFALALYKLGILDINYLSLNLYLFFASIVSMLGDLATSSIKRIYKVKDYGFILPGHGGILDRFDSLLFVLPFTYVFFSVLPL